MQLFSCPIAQLGVSYLYWGKSVSVYGMPKSSSAIGLRYQIEEAIVFFLLCLILNYFDQYWTDIGTSHEVFGVFFFGFPCNGYAMWFGWRSWKLLITSRKTAMSRCNSKGVKKKKTTNVMLCAGILWLWHVTGIVKVPAAAFMHRAIPGSLLLTSRTTSTMKT